jgi:dephospho-CoA kinase
MQSKKLVIGITGGVGSGKSVACKYFEKLGYRVIYADVVAKELYKTNKNLRDLLVEEFGKGILDSSGRISYINARKIIFSNKSNIKRVNSIVHPFVIDEIDRIIKGTKNRIVLVETAIMFESGYANRMDYVILIYTNKKTRIERVRKRDNVKISGIEWLMKVQMDEREKIGLADFIIKNNSTPAALYRNIRSFSKILNVLN